MKLTRTANAAHRTKFVHPGLEQDRWRIDSTVVVLVWRMNEKRTHDGQTSEWSDYRRTILVTAAKN